MPRSKSKQKRVRHKRELKRKRRLERKKRGAAPAR
jgi:hypothetical protein